jgi:hydroxymethylbilane synthase
VIRLGTRGSVLALAQAETVAAALRARGADVALTPMHTEGDRLAEARLGTLGGKGLFVRELEEALLDGRVDVAVHSLKDLPAETPAGLVLAAFPPREDPRDVLVSRAGGGLEALPAGTVVGTGSLRRRALALAARPDLRVEPIRGNVDTRLRKLDRGPWQALILAAAGLRRLGVVPRHAHALAPEVFVPAVGQGILALEARADDAATLAALGPLDDAATHACAVAERAWLARLGASCNTPMAAHAQLVGGRLRVTALVASEDGRRVLRADDGGLPGEAGPIGRRLAERLLAAGAAEVAPLDPAVGRARG